MKKLLTRTFTGFIFVLVIVASVVYNIPPLNILLSLFAILCAFELINIVKIIFKGNIKYIVLLLVIPVYCFMPFYLLYNSAWLLTSYADYSFEIILGFLIILWANDTGAYLIGSTIGKHKLAKRISPKKTWEGLIGGIAVALIVAFILSNYYPILNQSQWLTSAVIICVFGVVGDLFESFLKRKAEVKDSGILLPGHGGFLDRFDALLFAAPAYYLFLEIL